MKKALAIIIALALMMSVFAIPAFAKTTSGSAKPVIQVSNTGDNSNICVPAQQIVNTGNVINNQSVDAFGNALPTDEEKKALRDEGFKNSDIEDFTLAGFFGDDTNIDFEGSSINLDGTLDATCDQTITQVV